MSLEIFVSAIEDGEFDRSIVERAFKALVVDQAEDEWSFRAPDGRAVSGDLLIDEGPKVDGFSVDRPPSIPEFWTAMFEVLRQTRTILTWPGEEPSYCVANADLADELPEEMVEDMGPPVIVSSGAEILAAIERSA